MPEFKLDDIDKKKHPYKVDEGYFSELNSSIMERVSEPSKETSIVFSPKMVWAMASMGVMIFIGVFWFNNFYQPEQVDYLADITDEEILTYLDSYELTEDDLLLVVEESDFEDPLNEEILSDEAEIDEEALEELYLEYQSTEELLQI